MSQASATPEVPKRNNKSSIFIALLLIIVIVQAVKIYLDRQDKVELQAENASTEQELATTMQRLTDIQKELEAKIIEIAKLGGNVKDLEIAKAEVEKQLRIKTKATGNLIAELRSKVDGYEELLKLKDEEIEKLKLVNRELLTENKDLKIEKNKLDDSINKLEQTKTELASKVTLASRLKAENIKIVALTDRNKEKDPPFKARQIAKLKVDFSLAENDVAPIEGKKIMIRIVDQNGKVLFDMARGSGTFILKGREEFYTASQEVLFDNSKQKLSFIYDKGSDYTEGNYLLEVYTDDYLIGKGVFEVK